MVQADLELAQREEHERCYDPEANGGMFVQTRQRELGLKPDRF